MDMKGQMKLEKIPIGKDIKCELCTDKATYYAGEKKVPVCDKCIANL